MSGSSKQTTNSSSTTTPGWTPQLNALTDVFDKAKAAYDKASSVGDYSGDVIASFTPEQLANYRAMLSSGTTAANAASSTLPSATNSVTSGSDAAVGALDRLKDFTVQGNADTNIADATKYAESPYVSDAVTAAMRDATRNLNENVTPSLYRQSAAGNNINSSLTAIQDAINRRGLSDKTADVSANMRSELYKTGLNLAENARQFNNTTNLGAITSTGSLGNDTAANGYSGLTAALANLTGGLQLADTGASGLQANDQNEINRILAKREYQMQSPYDALSKYYGIVGDKSWGTTSTGTSETTKQPSAWEVIGGLMGAGGNLAKGFK